MIFFRPFSKFLLVHPRTDALDQRKAMPGKALQRLTEHSMSRLPTNQVTTPDL